MPGLSVENSEHDEMILFQRFLVDTHDSNRQDIIYYTSQAKFIQGSLLGLDYLLNKIDESFHTYRASEMEQGSALILYVFKRYIRQGASIDQGTFGIALSSTEGDSCTIFVTKLVDVFESHVETAERNIVISSQSFPLNGVLAGIRYLSFDLAIFLRKSRLKIFSRPRNLIGLIYFLDYTVCVIEPAMLCLNFVPTLLRKEACPLRLKKFMEM